MREVSILSSGSRLRDNRHICTRYPLWRMRERFLSARLHKNPRWTNGEAPWSSLVISSSRDALHAGPCLIDNRPHRRSVGKKLPQSPTMDRCYNSRWMTERQRALCEIEESGNVYRHAEQKMTALLSPITLHFSISCLMKEPFLLSLLGSNYSSIWH